MPQVGFEPTIPVCERAMTVHALDRAATVPVYNTVPNYVIYLSVMFELGAVIVSHFTKLTVSIEYIESNRRMIHEL
jgi:hypothetical protein